MPTDHICLYTKAVFGFPEWAVSAAVLLVLFLALVVLVRKHWTPSEQNKRPLTFFESLAVSFWMALVGLSAITWIWTVFKIHLREGSNEWTAPLLFDLAFSALFVGIIAATFFLEGIEIAYTELRDKDVHQFDVEVAGTLKLIRSFNKELKNDPTSFYEGREWLVVFLLVSATFIVERNEYYVPWFGHIAGAELVRLSITVVLTTFPLIWLAQGPGKYVAGRNSVAFLNFTPTRIAVKVLYGLWTKLRIAGLEYPSEKTSGLALHLIPGCGEPRNLPPNEFSFFADGLKKYGYGVLSSYDKITIRDNGSCLVESWTLSYNGIPKDKLKKYFDYEKDFVDGTVARLEDPSCKDSQYWVFESPLIGERVTDDLLAAWNSLLFAEEPSRWANDQEIKSANLNEFQVSALPASAFVTSRSDQRPTKRLDVHLGFGKPYPADSPQNGGKQAYLILWKVKAELMSGVVIMPERRKEQEYPFSKQYSIPSLRSTIEFALEPNTKYMFVYRANTSQYAVRYEDVEHQEEQIRFAKQRRPDENRGVPLKKTEASNLIFYVDSPLPGGQYEYKLILTPLDQKREDAGDSGLVAAAEAANGPVTNT